MGGFDRASTQIERLEEGLARSNDDIGALQEGKNVTDSKLEKVTKDLGRTHALLLNLQDNVHKEVMHDIKQLQDGLDRSNLNFGQLRADVDHVKGSLQGEKENIRQLGAKADDARNDLLKTNTVVHILEKRLVDVATGHKLTKSQSDEVKTALAKLQEDHDATKVNVAAFQGKVKDHDAHFGHLDASVKSNSAGLRQTQSKLDKACGNVDALSQMLEATRSNVQQLREGNMMAHESINGLQAELAEVAQLAHSAAAGLKDTNALVLPNLTLDATISGSPKRSNSRTSARRTKLDLSGSLRAKRIDGDMSPTSWI